MKPVRILSLGLLVAALAASTFAVNAFVNDDCAISQSGLPDSGTNHSGTSDSVTNDSGTSDSVTNHLCTSESEILAEYTAATGETLTDENFGGVYIDDSGRAVVCIKTDSPSEEPRLENRLAIREVKYSHAELTAALDAVTVLMSDYDSWQIRESGLSQRHNRIEIGLSECGDLEAFAARLLTELGLPESSRDMFDIYIYDSADDVYYVDKTT